MLKIFSNLLLIIVSIQLCKCSPERNLNKTKIEGTYYCKSDNSIKFFFNKNKFAFIKLDKTEGLANPCCDTISYGDWKHDNRGFIILNSPEFLKTFFINWEVNEKVNPNSDTIYFNIKNGIDDVKRNPNSAEVNYQLNVSAIGGYSNSFKENGQIFDTSDIKFYNKEKLNVYSLSLSASAKSSMFVKNLAIKTVFTMPYKVKDPNSNFFEINLPELTYGFFSYRRLNDDFVKIIDSNTLQWDGINFIKIPVQ